MDAVPGRDATFAVVETLHNPDADYLGGPTTLPTPHPPHTRYTDPTHTTDRTRCLPHWTLTFLAATLLPTVLHRHYAPHHTPTPCRYLCPLLAPPPTLPTPPHTCLPSTCPFAFTHHLTPHATPTPHPTPTLGRDGGCGATTVRGSFRHRIATFPHPTAHTFAHSFGTTTYTTFWFILDVPRCPPPTPPPHLAAYRWLNMRCS